MWRRTGRTKKLSSGRSPFSACRSRDGETIREVTANEVAIESSDPERVAELRRQLSHVSHFMKSLCEYLGRRANREDGCSGRFFEARFKCRELTSEAAVLVCGVYVDLNQIHAGEAETPEESTHTSAGERIAARQATEVTLEKETETKPSDSARPIKRIADWLCELTLQEGLDVDPSALNRTRSPFRASKKGLLPMSLDEYLSLLDWTGRQVRTGKRGAIPDHLAPILDRLQVTGGLWLELTTKFDQYFGRIVGRAADVAARAASAGRRFYRGHSACAAAFG